MEPRIVKEQELVIAGVTGDGMDTGGVWAVFEDAYDKTPFGKLRDDGYEVRFDYDGKCDVHVGFAVDSATSVIAPFTALTLPPSDYAVFDVFVKKGYDSENENMSRWLSGNDLGYTQSRLDGKHFVAEVYNDRFKGGDQFDSVVEIWIPVEKKKIL